MKKLIVLVMVLTIMSWPIPRPMESVENYGVLMVHGAYGWEKGFIWPHMSEDYWEDSYGYEDFKSEIKTRLDNVIAALDTALPSAYDAAEFLGAANLGDYDKESRITHWINKNILEDSISKKPQTSYIYNWRSFSNPANSSSNNAHELGDRLWNRGNINYGKGGFGHRRTLMEEAQEVKAKIYKQRKNGNTVIQDSVVGQIALDSIRKNSDFFRQIPSRYILVGHSMGGVVSREYVQGDFYNDDVDKIITLDSPHEGTGALNMQVAKEARDRLGADAVMNAYRASMVSGTLALALITIGKEKAALTAGLWVLGVSFVLSEITPFAVRGAAPEIYHESDPLVYYVDPKSKGVGTIDNLNSRSYDVEKMPMFRILASENGITFSDPTPSGDGDIGYLLYRSLVPDVLSLPFENLISQIMGSSRGQAHYVNSVFSFFAGVAGVPIQENGSSIVPEASSEARNVTVLNDPRVDSRRAYFNAAPHASSSSMVGFDALLSLCPDAMLAIEYAMMVSAVATAPLLAAKIAMGVAAASSIALLVAPSIEEAVADLTDSHTMPLKTWFLDTMMVSKNTFTPIGNGASSHTPYLMEDFLYERPFVNLALNDSRTMGMLANDPKLNPNCYFESDSLQKIPLCEVGLYGSRDSVVIDPVTMKETHIYNAAVAKTDSAGNVIRDSSGNVVYDSVYYGTFEQRDYVGFRKSPLKFKSESDWYKVGVKVDRWERVDGLKPNGDLAPKGVPIRHVERYSVPDIVVTGFIEKYSFVVDDLMPHRMRQIKMTFNSNEEVAWKCDISKAEDDSRACAVYKRQLGNAWTLAEDIGDKGYVPHPIKKNGRFDFEARKYFGNLGGYTKSLTRRASRQNACILA